jgi:hypothetical protein
MNIKTGVSSAAKQELLVNDHKLRLFKRWIVFFNPFACFFLRRKHLSEIF